MKIGRLIVYLIPMLAGLLTFFSCGRVDNTQAKKVEAFTALKNILAGMHIAIIEKQFSNSIVFLEWVESDLNSSNNASKSLSSVCDSVWFSSSLDDWRASSTNGQTASMIAIIGRFRFEGITNVTGISFSGKPIEISAPPDSTFRKMKLNSTHPP